MNNNIFSTRGESVVVSYVLMIGVMTVLSALLISAAGGYLDTKNEEVTETQAKITVEAIASEIEEVDKNAQRIDEGSNAEGYYKYKSQAEDLIGQYPYKISISNTSESDVYNITVDVQSVDVSQTTRVELYSIDSISNLTVSSGSSLTYVYQTGGNLTLSENDLTLESWSINTSGDYSIPSDETFSNGIKTRNGGDIDEGEESTVYGPIISDGSIDTEDNLVVFGQLEADNQIQVGSNTIIYDSITSEGSIQTADNTTIQGNVNSDASATFGEYTEIIGSVDITNDLTIENNASVENDVESGGVIDINSNATINGTVTADEVILYDDSTVQGDVVVPSGTQLVCSGTGIQINGQSCSNYKNNYY